VARKLAHATSPNFIQRHPASCPRELRFGHFGHDYRTTAMTVSLVPRGRNFVRGVMLKAQGLVSEGSARDAALARWGSQGEAAVKAAVSAVTVNDVGTSEAREFMSLVAERSTLGRLAGLRRVPWRTRVLKITNGARGYWVSQARPKPLSKPTLDGFSLTPLKVACIIATTKESLEAQDEVGEQTFQADMERALVAAMDEALLDPTNAGVAGEVPAAITNGVTTNPATGDLRDDFANLIAAFQGDLSAAYFVTDPETATRISLARDGDGPYWFPEAGPRGGSILNIPLLTSRLSPGDSSGGRLALIDPNGIAAQWDNIVIDKAAHATLQMDDDPDHPSDASTVMVNLWQRNLIALRAEVRANWEVQRTGSVAVLEGLYWLSREHGPQEPSTSVGTRCCTRGLPTCASAIK
jgi:HK97 family phage major capsid protein